MWYQINKIVAMVYPQWSDGYSVKGKDFKYPFTQVPTASPLIRLRVGDVIKSNYSRTNLSRLHGVGERIVDKDNKFPEDFTAVAYELMPGLYRKDSLTVAGLGVNDSGPRTVKIDHPVSCTIKDQQASDSLKDFVVVTIDNPFYEEFSPEDLLKIPPNLPKEPKIEVVVDASKIVVKEEKKKYEITQKDIDEMNKWIDVVNETTAKARDDLEELGEHLAPIKHYTIETYESAVIGDALHTTTVGELMSPVKEVNDNGSKTLKSNNPITKSYESGMSRGLAGFITQLDVNYNEVNWETSRIGSKAPMMVKITVNFAPIHDIPPGLDHNGMLRAPTYNVGRINNQLFGDPKDHSYTGSGRDLAMKKYKILRSLNNLDYKE
jgi:hypothetical protein